MQAVEYVKPGRLTLKESNLPEPDAHEVCIKVAYAGICGTDLHIINQESPAAERVILGHEFSGTVSAAGKSVNNISVGDAVAVDPNDYCGFCEFCRIGKVHFCRHISPIGVFRNGAWAEYCIVPANQVYTLKSESELARGALAEPLSCILHGWDRLQPIRQEQQIGIMGAGLIGLLWGLTLRQYGLKNILFSEISDQRSEQARRLGFRVHRPENINACLKMDQPFDILIDCSGNPQAIENGVDWLRPMGKLLLFGICPENIYIRLNPYKIFQKELTLMGSVINPFTFSRALNLLEEIQFPIEDLGVAFFALGQYKEAIEAAKSGRHTKVIFNMTPPSQSGAM